MNPIRSCTNSKNVSFPLRTNIRDLSGYYGTIHNEKPDIKASFVGRDTNPYFSDPSRVSGEIHNTRDSIIVTYNGDTYILHSVQICLATHTDWLLTNDPGVRHSNKIDIVITLENQNEQANVRFFITTIPLIIDKTLSIDNSYLEGLSYLSETNSYSLQTLFVGLKNYFFYITCLEPHGDEAFVYVNTDGLKITQNVYNSLLAIWTNQHLSTIQQKTLDTISPLKKNIKDAIQKINTSTDLKEIQYQLTNLQTTVQTPTLNPSVDTWPRYSPPYDIILNVPAKIITATNMEGFAVSTEDTSTRGSTDQGGLTNDKISTETAVVQPKIEAATVTYKTGSIALGNLKCVSLDIDTVDSSGNIHFDTDGNMELSLIQKQRNALRKSNQPSFNNMPTLLKYIAIFLVVFTGAVLIYIAFKKIISLGKVQPNMLPSDSKNYGLYGIILVIFAFTGFIIGASIQPTSIVVAAADKTTDLTV